MTHDIDILIVGGGAAGIGAARRLSTLGIATVLIDALERLGGRAHTVSVRGHRLDLGCGWLHSGDRNPWTELAERSGFHVDRRLPAWGDQFRNLGFSAAEQEAAGKAFAAWTDRLRETPPVGDRAGDALPDGGEWNAFVATMTGFISGAAPARMSAMDYVAYDEAATEANWRVAEGYGNLIASSMPADLTVHSQTIASSIELSRNGVCVTTDKGSIGARAVILAVPTTVLASGSLRMPIELDPWRAAAAALPLGRNEKVFLEIVGDAPFEDETYVLGNPRSSLTGSHYIRPLGAPVIECFLGGETARVLDNGPDAGFAFALDELASLFGSDIRRFLRPLTTSGWADVATIGGAYSYAVPGQADARALLARPFDDRIFFAGEATHPFDFTTAHGAYESGVRAAEEALAVMPRRS